MAYLLFVDESGQDHRESPREVLAGIAVKDADVWGLIDALNKVEERLFGLRYSREKDEIKGKKFLKKKVFRQIAYGPPIAEEERRRLSLSCILHGDGASRDEIRALAQAKLAFVREAFELCSRWGCRAFASIVDTSAPKPVKNVLRKDYAFLFERFFYFLEDQGGSTQGIVVFDELEKAQSHLLIEQMEEYFLRTKTGQRRSRCIIPEPFFVHSDLTTLIQVADLVAYIVSWADQREELRPFYEQVLALRYRARRRIRGARLRIWSFVEISDLRGWEDQAAEKGKGNEA